MGNEYLNDLNMEWVLSKYLSLAKPKKSNKKFAFE